MRSNALLLLCLGSCLFFKANSQCVPPVTPPILTCGTGTPLADGVSINAGQTFDFGGTGGSFSNITVNGGTLLLCGSATLTNVNFNSGTIVINAGATITFAGSFNTGSNISFFNSGNTTFNLSVLVQGANNFVYNAPGGAFTINSASTIGFNQGFLINNGTINAPIVNVNSGATVCLGPGSVNNLLSMTNNALNLIAVPSGFACLSYTGSLTGNSPITASPNLRICQKTGASNPDPAVVGSATVIPNCTDCPASAQLPLQLTSFKGSVINGQAELEWTTAFEENVKSFIIERSQGGQNFEAVGEIAANNQPSTYKFRTGITKDSYFRLRMVDIDGKTTYSYRVLLKLKPEDFEFGVLSNPVHKSYAEFSINVSRSQRGDLIIIDYTGRRVQKAPVVLNRGNNIVSVNLAGVSAGQYFIYFRGSETESKAIPFVKL